MSKTRIVLAGVLASAICGAVVQAQTPIPPASADFALAASQSGHYEVMAAHVALAETKDPRVHAFAERMIQDHERLDQALRQAAAASGLKLPPSGLSGDQSMLLGGLQGLRGRDFDAAYMRQQVLAHAQAVAVEDSFAASGSDPTLRKAAEAALPTIRDHLRDAQELEAELKKG